MGLSFGVKVLLVLAAALLAIIVAMAAGILARLDGARLAACVMRGGATFGVSLTLLILVLSSLGALA
ncbi:hypothetical protein [Streptomyces rimosus]|uniref:hypothetical protein n=1 Tax=Streptomyces rimosus TaxID=1927 RepID=UPI0004C06862|nr:hypothetical protein [Streptomyces rimosus]